MPAETFESFKAELSTLRGIVSAGRNKKGLGVRLAILQFLFGVIHKKVGPLQMRNAEFKILKTAWSIAQRALRESFFFFLPKIFLLSWKNEGILHQLNAGAEE